MKKFVLSVLMCVLCSMPAWADVCDRGRISDIPGHHGGSAGGWIILILIIVSCVISNWSEKKS